MDSDDRCCLAAFEPVGFERCWQHQHIIFSYDANPGLTRTGAITIAGQTLTVIQAGSTYVRASMPATVLTASGLHSPTGVTVDGSGNVYIADNVNNAIRKWTATNNVVTTVVSTGLTNPAAVAADGVGNLYIVDTYNDAIKKWTATNHTVTTLVATGLNEPFGVAVGGEGNVYIADTLNNAIKELPRAFVDPTAKTEGSAAGSDTLPTVLPAAENLSGPFAPTNDRPWLTIGSITNGRVTFAFSSSLGTNRTAHLSLLGQIIPAIQTGGVITPPELAGAVPPGSGMFQLVFSNRQTTAFSVLSSTNLSLPLTNWTIIGTPTNFAPALFRFAALVETNGPQRYYLIRSP